MLTLQNVSIARGANILLEHISLELFEKQIIGLVGANGCGKSSLFAAIKGELTPSEGLINLRKNVRINSLTQEEIASDQSALDYVVSGDEALALVFEKLLHSEQVQDYSLMMECHNELAELDGYAAQAKAAKILNGLGFGQDELEKSVKAFSGGWRMRLNLARCLFAPSDMLLLDEPTNHLDMEAIIWLEKFLKYYPGAVLLVSHDRDFLDHAVTHIGHIDNRSIRMYKGDYSSFEVQRAHNIAAQNSQFKKQQTQIAHAMKYVDKFRYKATKARQAQSRLKAIEKIKLVDPIREMSPFTFSFKEPDRMPSPMLRLAHVDLGYDAETTILTKVNVSIAAGQRIGLLGVNGAGKSTLIKCMCGELQPQAGEFKSFAGVSIGYFAQHQIDYLPLDDTPMEVMKRMAPDTGEKDLTSYLASFGFSRDQSLTKLARFSGGEKARVALAMIIWRKPNLLLLDEPTNHLDLEVRAALMYALQNYSGTLILVSHDRYLMRALVDELLIVKNGRVEWFQGAVEDYQIGV